MNAIERADAIIKDILVNHLPRIKEGLEKGYVDENQVLIMYDHLVRARILKEEAAPDCSMPLHSEHEDALSRINAELDAEVAKEPVRGQNVHAVVLDEANFRLKDEIEKVMAIVIARNELNPDALYVQNIKPDGYPEFTREKGHALLHPVNEAKELAQKWTRKYGDMSFHAEIVSELNWKQHVEKHACVCGGTIVDLPTTPETMLECKQCGRRFLDEFELSEARKNETKGGTKCADATYWTTGTLAGGTQPVPMETEINLNGRKTTIKAKGGKFVLSYEEIVRMAVNQKRTEFNKFAGPDSELPMLTCTYRHRVDFSKLPGERDGSLWKGKSVECTPGMCIDAMDTGSA
jgi:hypothetical protein